MAIGSALLDVDAVLAGAFKFAHGFLFIMAAAGVGIFGGLGALPPAGSGIPGSA